MALSRFDWGSANTIVMECSTESKQRSNHSYPLLRNVPTKGGEGVPPTFTECHVCRPLTRCPH